MSKSRYRTRESANVKAKIHDKDEFYQCQDKNSRQRGVLMSRLRSRTRTKADFEVQPYFH